MTGRRIARPAAARVCAIAMLAAITIAGLGMAGPATAATHAGPAAQHRSAAHHGLAARHHSILRSHRARARSVTLTTLVAGVAVRTKPALGSRVIARIRKRGTRVTLQCYARGTRIAGNPIWYRLSRPLRGYVTSYYMNSHKDPVAGVARCASGPFGRTYRTLVSGVHIRYWPTAAATRLATLGRPGSKVTINCYVHGQLVSGDAVWYHVIRPVAGFVAGAHLNTGRDPAYKIPACW